MDIANDIRARVIAAADELYRENERQRFPLVDEVRRLSRVGMNDCSAIMKEWRKAQTAAVVNVVVEVPDKINVAMKQAVVEIWSIAQDLANESLVNAQQAWDHEREGAEGLRVELSEAYEVLSAELVDTKEEVEKGRRALEEANTLVSETKQQLLREGTARVDLEKMVEGHNQRIEELKEELKQERENCRGLQQDKSELAAENIVLTEKLNALTGRVEEANNLLEIRDRELKDIKQAFQELSVTNHAARESAASLQGQIDSLKHVNNEVLKALTALKSETTTKKTGNRKGVEPDKK